MFPENPSFLSPDTLVSYALGYKKHWSLIYPCATPGSTAAMVSSSVDVPGSAMAEKTVFDEERRASQYEKNRDAEAKPPAISRDDESSSLKVGFDSTHRQLRPRHIQLIGIGGTIGTALYVQIGHGLINGGPGSLFLAFTIWYVYAINFGHTARTMIGPGSGIQPFTSI